QLGADAHNGPVCIVPLLQFSEYRWLPFNLLAFLFPYGLMVPKLAQITQAARVNPHFWFPPAPAALKPSLFTLPKDNMRYSLINPQHALPVFRSLLFGFSSQRPTHCLTQASTVC